MVWVAVESREDRAWVHRRQRRVVAAVVHMVYLRRCRFMADGIAFSSGVLEGVDSNWMLG